MIRSKQPQIHISFSPHETATRTVNINFNKANIFLKYAFLNDTMFKA